MRCASIDVGTNTALLFIADLEEGKIKSIVDTSSITRLGEGLIRNGYLLDSAMDRALAELKEYRRIAESYGVERILCVGTSALREASNSNAFLEAVQKECGIAIRIISGEEEAYFTYLSVRESVSMEADGHFFIIDIGGGSTELISGTKNELVDCVSLPVGTVKITEQFVHHDPPGAGEVESMKDHVRSLLQGYHKWRGMTIVGTGGTVTNIAAIHLGLEAFDKEKIEGHRMTLTDIQKITGMLMAINTQERGRVRGMEKGREDIIAQGSLLLGEIMQICGSKECYVHTGSVRQGVLINYYPEMQNGNS